MVQSSAPWSLTVTAAFFTPRRASVASTVSLIWRPYWLTTVLSRFRLMPDGAGSSVTITSLDSSVPATPVVFSSMALTS